MRVTSPETGKRSTNTAQECAKGARRVCKGCTEVHRRERRWGRSPGGVGRWSGCGGCRPSAQKGLKKLKKKKIGSVPGFTGLTMKNRLSVGRGRVWVVE